MKQSSMAMAIAVGAAGMLILALAGCSSESSQMQSTVQGPAGPSVKMSKAQTADLADGKVTFDEYKAAMRRYVACDAKAGYTVQVGPLDDNDQYQMAIPNAARQSGVDDKCDQQEYFLVSSKWQIAHEDTSQLAIATGKCIAAKGYTPAKTWDERYSQAVKLGIDPAKCEVKYPSDEPLFTPTP
jgi:hypothetical protein